MNKNGKKKKVFANMCSKFTRKLNLKQCFLSFFFVVIMGYWLKNQIIL